MPPRSSVFPQAALDDFENVRLIFPGNARNPPWATRFSHFTYWTEIGSLRPNFFLCLIPFPPGSFFNPVPVVGNQRISRGQPGNVKSNQGSRKILSRKITSFLPI